MKKTNQEKGITLIALIITIVVLLILAVVAIRAVQGDGIIRHAQNARDDYQTAQSSEQSALLEYEYEIEKAQGKTTQKKQEYLLDKTYGVNVGARVAYTSGVEGYSEEWSVLKVENGQILLLSKPIGTLTLQGKDGYDNAVSRLNAMCAPYGNGEGAEKARSIKVEDINEVLEYNPHKGNPDGSVYQSGTGKEYGNTVTYSYKDGSIYYKASNGLEGTKTKYTSFEDIDGTIISAEYPNEVIEHTSTYYFYNIRTLINQISASGSEIGAPLNSTLYRMISGSPEYWLANQDICTNESRTSWQIRYVSTEHINAATVYHSFDDDDQTPYTKSVRAVVYLKAGTKLVDANNDGVYEIA